MSSFTPEILLQAYAAGLFPMAESADDPELFWVDPKQRGIIPLDNFHVSRRLRRTIKGGSHEIRYDSAFEDVLHLCAEPQPDRPETWINAEIIALYAALHRMGHAHSVEVWGDDGQLVGGLYGVALGGAFFGESMFSRRTDASKIALVYLVATLIRSGFVLLDTQFMTDHLSRFGTIEIPRAEYRRRLRLALSIPARFQGVDDVGSVLQSTTQTS